MAKVLELLASVAHDTGDLAGASAAYAEALATARRAGAPLDVARLLTRSARTAADAGDLAGARAALAEARKTLQGTGDTSTLRALDLESGFLALAEGRPREAIAIARRLLAVSEKPAKSLHAPRAALLLAQALATDAATPEAIATAEDAVRAANDSRDATLALSAAIVQARLRAAGDRDAALHRLETIREEAARRGLIVVELDALAATGEICARRGETNRARGILAETMRRARQNGLLLAARRAETLLASL